MAPPALLSRGLDPLLGIFTGFFAYYLYETHPKNNLSPEERLAPLVRWKWAKYQDSRKEQLRALDTA